MAERNQWVDVGRRKLELSNLDKILYPQDQVSKAEVINYYLQIAPTILRHIKGRPLTLIRYPDGIENQRFYQKNIPGWAPDWIDSVILGEEKKEYIMAAEPASLVWLANLAALELHQMHSRKPRFDQPDYMVFDLDPPEGEDFQKVVDTAFALKEHAEQFSYHIFVKTTGGKGIHLVSPIEPDKNTSAVFEASKEIARSFVDRNKDETTLQIKKNARKGRILVDIYRNRSSQTIVSPYSLRGRTGIPVSMPLSWEELEGIESSSEYTIFNSADKIKEDGDAWDGIGSYAVTLHTARGHKAGSGTNDDRTENQAAESSTRSGRVSDESTLFGAAELQQNNAKTDKRLADSPYRKTPNQLREYSSKRNFSITPEPKSGKNAETGNRFVVHRHHATRLHYDLRLENNGVLKSWAIPKGLPPRPGVKRLAVQTEDHPIDYLKFEGRIPKQEYGGGDMWIFANGKYTTLKEKKDGLYFRLESPGASGEYRMHKMKENQWLLEKTDQPQIDWLNEPIRPMHGESLGKLPDGDYGYEVKWDGIRALISLEDGQIRIRSRNQNDITSQFPELRDVSDSFRAACGLFDGEIVSLDETGAPEFQTVINRLRSSGKAKIERASKIRPVYCYLFDCLYLDGRSIVNEPLTRRYEWLNDVVKKGGLFRLSEIVDDGEALFKAAQQHGLEGIMAKLRMSKYQIGRRSDDWIKVKIRHTVECQVIGYTRGKSERAGMFGALLVAEKKKDSLVYRGKVGTGFGGESAKDLFRELKQLKKRDKPSLKNLPGDEDIVWVEPALTIEVTYGRFSGNGMFKEAVYVKMRPDLWV